MGRPRKGARVSNPYRHGGGWQIKIVDPLAERRTSYASYRTEKEAWSDRPGIEARLLGAGISIESAVRQYEKNLLQRGCRQRTAKVAASAILHFLTGEGMLQGVTAQSLRQRIGARLSTPTGRFDNSDGEPVERPRSVASVASELRQTKLFIRWASSVGLCRLPAGLAEVRVIGRREEGKEQLSAGEAARFGAEALRRARAGDEGGLAAYAVLVLGVRARELLDRRVNDLEGGVLWIRRGKTRRARRGLQVPDPLHQLLVEQAEDRPAGALMFGEAEGEGRPRATSWLEKQVRVVCGAAGVTAVCPHGLRGTHATLAEEAGVSAVAVAASLGHAPGSRVTERCYTTPEARQGAGQERVLRVLQGGAR